MRTSRVLPNFYELYDWKRIEAFLARQAAKGWRLRRIEGTFWRYERAAPACVRYAVVYRPDVDETTPRPDISQREMNAVCAASGWRYVTDWGGMHIYENGSESPVPLESDEQLRLQTIHATMRRRYLPPMAAICALELLLLALLRESIQNAWGMHTALALCLFLALLYAPLAIAGYFVWYGIARHAVRHGRACPSNPVMTVVSVVWMVACLGLLLLDQWMSGEAAPMARIHLFARWGLYFSLYFLIAWGVNRLRIYLRDRGILRGVNAVVTCGVSFLLYGLLYFLLLRWL